jgi:hypothetical protein
MGGCAGYSDAAVRRSEMTGAPAPFSRLISATLNPLNRRGTVRVAEPRLCDIGARRSRMIRSMGSIFAEKALYGSDAVTPNPAKSGRALGSAFRGMRTTSCDFIFGTVRSSAVQARSRNKRPPQSPSSSLEREPGFEAPFPPRATPSRRGRPGVRGANRAILPPFLRSLARSAAAAAPRIAAPPPCPPRPAGGVRAAVQGRRPSLRRLSSRRSESWSRADPHSPICRPSA